MQNQNITRYLLIVVVMCVIISGCQREQEVYSTKYNAFLSKLDDIECEEYKEVAVCEIYSFLFNTGHFDSQYSKGRVSMFTLFGKLSRTVPLRCDIDGLLRELVRLDNEKGSLGRFGESFTLLGNRTINCKQ